MWRRLRGVSVAAVLCVAAACARGSDAVDPEDVVTPEPDDAGTPEARVPLPSGSSGDEPDGAAPSEEQDSGGDPKICDGKVVINELQPNGPNGAEFVELYNPGDCAVSLGGWKLLYRSDENNPGAPPYEFPAGASIAAKSFLLLGNAKFQGTNDGVLAPNSGLGNNGGQVGLFNDKDQDNPVDALGWGSSTSGKYTEKSPAPLPSPGGSISRKSDGVDTNDNAADFTTTSSPTPRAPN